MLLLHSALNIALAIGEEDMTTCWLISPLHFIHEITTVTYDVLASIDPWDYYAKNQINKEAKQSDRFPLYY